MTFRKKKDPADWMWAEAIDLMARADRMHRQFFRLASAPERSQAFWEPPVDVFANDDELVIVVALPGVSADGVEVASEPGAIVVRAERACPFSGSSSAVRQLEIPYGYFERRIALEAGTYEPVSNELTHGCLILRLRKTA